MGNMSSSGGIRITRIGLAAAVVIRCNPGDDEVPFAICVTSSFTGLALKHRDTTSRNLRSQVASAKET